uniref:Uncharacterized protein n=1 Tax=Anguilla anguilla TaxID=7936 RepID=A0A0E9QRJ5_ANGAN
MDCIYIAPDNRSYLLSYVAPILNRPLNQLRI